MRTGTTLGTITAALLLAACGGGSSDSTAPGPTATTVTVAAGNNQVAPVSTALTDSLAVLVKDNNNQPMAGVTVAWAATGGGSVLPANSQTGADGIARARRTLGATAGTAGTTATVSGLPVVNFTAVGQVQGGVTIASNPLGTLTDTVLGTLVDPEPRPSVKVTDQNGAPVAGVTVVWTATGGGSVTAASVPTDVNGISTVGYTFGTAAGGAYAAHATVTGLINSPVNFTLTATHGAPTQLTKVAGDGGFEAPGAMLLQTVQVSDAHGNPVPGIQIDWSATGGGGSVGPVHDTTGVTGLASTNRTMGALGPQSTGATAPALAGPPTVSFASLSATLVRVGDDFFSPTTTTIVAGDSVVWQWQGITVAHNLTFAAVAGRPANEGNRTSGSVWRVFTTPGTYNYQCTNHPGMVGSVTVTP